MSGAAAEVQDARSACGTDHLGKKIQIGAVGVHCTGEICIGPGAKALRDRLIMLHAF
jgi:hypothetical protein